jgi:hypothetical protein
VLLPKIAISSYDLHVYLWQFCRHPDELIHSLYCLHRSIFMTLFTLWTAPCVTSVFLMLIKLCTNSVNSCFVHTGTRVVADAKSALICGSLKCKKSIVVNFLLIITPI